MQSLREALNRPRHLICRGAAICAGSIIAIVFTMIFDSRSCVDIVGGTVTPAEQHIGMPLRITWQMKPSHYCDGEVTDFFRHESGFFNTGETRPTGYAKVWDGTPGIVIPFVQLKTVPDGLEGTTYYEPRIRRWHNILQKWFNPINATGVSLKFERLSKLSKESRRVPLPLVVDNTLPP